MEKLLTFLTLTFVLHCFGQKKEIESQSLMTTFCLEKIRDSIFENVIKITDNDVVSDGINYLFTTPIPKSIELPIIFVQTEVPVGLLSSIYPEFQKLTVITPNWNYYKKISNGKLPNGIICAEPMASSVIYEFNREKDKFSKDSLVIMGGFPDMKFEEKYKLNDHEAEIYYSEYYGSICCPTDLQYSNTPTREDFIKFFERENNTEITDTYIEQIGDEGESKYHYTLNNLADFLRIKFILERGFYRTIDRENKEIITIPQIYTPFILETNKKRIRKL